MRGAPSIFSNSMAAIYAEARGGAAVSCLSGACSADRQTVGDGNICGHFFCLGQGGDLAHDFRLDPGALVDVYVGDAPEVRDIDVGDLAVEAGLGSNRRPPAGGLVVIDRP